MAAVSDRRQLKTRAALHGAFRSLLLGQGYGGLTVGAVADMANVGRSTFYEHFRTMDDLLRESVQGPFTTLADLVDQPARGDALLDLLTHFRENQQVARVLLTWPTRPVLASALAQLIADRLRAASLAAPLVPAEVIARQVAEMHLALIDAWIAGRPAMLPQAVAQALGAGTDALMSVLAGKVR